MAAASASTAEGSHGSHSDDSEFLGQLQFGEPDRMYAIPLVARGRGVAVMYADYGNDGVSVNLEALETIVRVAALTVELLASSQTAMAENRQMADANFEGTPHDSEGVEIESPVDARFDDTIKEMPVEMAAVEDKTPDFAFSESVSYEGGLPTEPAFSEPAVGKHTVETEEAVVETPQSVEAPHLEAELAQAEAEEQFAKPVPEYEPKDGAMVFDSGGSIEPAAVEKSSPFDIAVEPFEPAGVIGGGRVQTVESAIEVAPSSLPKARLSDRPVDLPIEVPEEERRLHNDARRFARLLVSEIKLYNEKKVLEGRQSHDLYDRLREAIDRSREMYDKRVQPPVAARFDYFHYELLNALAEGNADRFGTNYPGANV